MQNAIEGQLEGINRTNPLALGTMLAPSIGLIKYWRSLECDQILLHCRRSLHSSSIVASGHSKWATIKHDKARNDAHKTRERSIMANEIVNAVRFYGPDPKTNNRLTAAIAGAKRTGMSKSSIDTAMLRGQGKSASGATLESITIEAVLPPVGLIIECETDSKGRALQELRSILTRRGAQASSTQYLFEKRGRIVFGRPEGSLEVDDVMEDAIEAGAIDLEEDVDEPGRVVVYTEPTLVADVEKIAEREDIERHSTAIVWFPKEDTVVEADDDLLGVLGKLENELEEYNGVQAIYTNLSPGLGAGNLDDTAA